MSGQFQFISENTSSALLLYSVLTCAFVLLNSAEKSCPEISILQEIKPPNTVTDGNVILFGVNIFDYEWKNTHKSVKVRDPLYDQEYKFPIYTVVINGHKATIAACFVSQAIVPT